MNLKKKPPPFKGRPVIWLRPGWWGEGVPHFFFLLFEKVDIVISLLYTHKAYSIPYISSPTHQSFLNLQRKGKNGKKKKKVSSRPSPARALKIDCDAKQNKQKSKKIDRIKMQTTSSWVFLSIRYKPLLPHLPCAPV